MGWGTIMHRVSRLLFVLVVAASLIVGFPGADTAKAWSFGPWNGGAEKQSYIVAFAPHTSAPAALARGLAAKNGFKLDFVYEHAIQGFAAQLTPAQVQILSRIPGVTIQPDEETHISAQTIPVGIQRIGTLNNATANINGLDDRVAANVAVLDTGIDYTHPDLNVVGGYNCASSNRADYKDYNGHGTHVAGTIAAMDNDRDVVGVAPGANLYSVRVFSSSGSGYTSWLICGLDWITQNAGTIQVANYSGGQTGTSGGGCSSSSLHRAVCSLVNAGVPLVAAAGNNGRDASTTLPAAYPEVIAVGAMVDTDGKPGGQGPRTSYGSDDTRASFSNYGSAVTLYAPGVSVLSTWPGSRTAYLSGTSQATPHVTGAIALYLANHPGTSPATVKQVLVDTGESGSWGGTWKQPLVNVGNWGPPPAVNDVAVTAVSASSSVGLGATVPVTVTVKNTGNQPQSSVAVSLTDNGAAVGTPQTISLNPGDSQDVTFDWSPSTAGSHTLVGAASISEADPTLSDNTQSATVDVTTPVHDVAVSGISAPSSTFTGTPATVTVMVKNTGNQPESVSVSLTDNSTAVGSAQTISLNPGDSQDVSFTWTPGSAGSHTLVGAASISNDANSSDNSQSTTVSVTNPSHDVAISGVSVPGTPVVNVATTVTVTVQNTGNQPESSITVSLTDNGASVGSAQTISLNAGQSQAVSFSWTPGAGGSHTLEGTATIGDDATPGDNTTSVTVDVSEVNQAFVQNVTLGTQRSGFMTVFAGSVSINSTAGPVPNATVSLTLTGPSTNSSLTLITDASGNASFTARVPRRGQYTLTVTNVTADGYIYTPSMNVKDSATVSV